MTGRAAEPRQPPGRPGRACGAWHPPAATSHDPSPTASQPTAAVPADRLVPGDPARTRRARVRRWQAAPSYGLGPSPSTWRQPHAGPPAPGNRAVAAARADPGRRRGGAAIALTAGGVGGFVGYALHPDAVAAADHRRGPGQRRPGRRPVLAGVHRGRDPADRGRRWRPSPARAPASSSPPTATSSPTTTWWPARRSVRVTFNSGKQLDVRRRRHRPEDRPRRAQGRRHRAEVRRLG